MAKHRYSRRNRGVIVKYSRNHQSLVRGVGHRKEEKEDSARLLQVYGEMSNSVNNIFENLYFRLCCELSM